MISFVKDIRSKSLEARQDAYRELTVTIVVSLVAFFIGPLAVALISLKGSVVPFLEDFWGVDIFIAAVSLLSISVYSISKEYNTNGRESFAFPHAATILTVSIVVAMISFAAYTVKLFNASNPDIYEWRGAIAAPLGVFVFFVSCYVAYSAMVLRNHMDYLDAPGEMRRDQEDLVGRFQAKREATLQDEIGQGGGDHAG